MPRSPRAREVALSLILLAGACRSPASTPAQRAPDDAAVTPVAADPRRPATSEEAVRAHVGPGAHVTPWDGPVVPGFDLFFVTTPSTEGDPGTGTGLVYSSGKILSGPEAMRAVVASGSKDAHALASYASHLLAAGAAPLLNDDGVAEPVAHKALIKPPTLTGTRLEFWTYQPPLGAPELLRTRVDLATLDLVSAGAETLATPAQDPTKTTAP